MKYALAISLALLVLAGCATKETTYWQKDKKHHAIVLHHVRKSFGRVHDQTEELSTKAMTPAEVAVYDIGRLPDGHGEMSEAHRYYRVVQSEHFDLRLPEAGKDWKYGGSKKPTGPKKLFYSPTYTPPPQSERITDAVHRARGAERDAKERARLQEELAGNERWTAEYAPLVSPLIVRQDVRLLEAAVGPVPPALPAAPCSAGNCT